MKAMMIFFSIMTAVYSSTLAEMFGQGEKLVNLTISV